MKLMSLAALTTLLFSCASSEKTKSLAQCLNDKGVTMYGAAWCGPCKEQKEDFGDAFSLIHYVDCGIEPKKCIEENIEYFPTVIMGDGKRIVGYRSLERLAKETGCEY